MAGWLHEDLNVLGLPGQVLVLRAVRAWAKRDIKGRDCRATRLHRGPTRPYKCRAEDVALAKARRTRRGAWQPDGQQHPQPGQDASPKSGDFWHPASRLSVGNGEGWGWVTKG